MDTRTFEAEIVTPEGTPLGGSVHLEIRNSGDYTVQFNMHSSSIGGNFDFARWDPIPVSASPGGDSAFGVSQLVGNGWEWTSTVFHPFTGFEPFSFYLGYSAQFFGGGHFVLKGGSARTAACLLRRSFRNWFRPDYRYAYAGFRCVE